MSDPADRRIGTVIAAKWRVDSLLGSGSMAAVYAVTHRNGARAALKILHPTLCTDEGVCERFLGEGYLTNSVKHTGIVRVLDDGVTDDGCVFLVMDLLEGRTLETFRQERGGKIELVEVLDIADKLMDALNAVHQAGIIHRDMKPQNVFICDDGSVKLLDFGVARIFDAGAQSKLSLFGLVLGTPSFMSPEQALGSREKVDHRSDIWSLGATIFTSLTGETVHLGPHVQAKLLAAATVKARSIALVKQDLPASIALAIDTALRFKKEDRWQTVDSFRRALREARVPLGLGRPQSVPPPGFLDEVHDLDGPTHADTGERDAFVVVRDNSESPPVKAEVVVDRPVGGVGGTLIGVGAVKREVPTAEDESAIAATVPQLAAIPRAARARPAINPKAVVHAPTPIESDVDGQTDGSYPAASSTVKLDEDDALLAQVVSRRSSGTVWVVGCALALAAASGIAFFAVNRPSGDAQSATSAQAPVTTATGPVDNHVVAPAEAPVSSSRIDVKDLMKDASVAPESPIKAYVSTPPPLRTAHAAQPPVTRNQRASVADHPRSSPPPNNNARSPVNQDPPPAPTPAPAPTAAPDPFGTPD